MFSIRIPAILCGGAVALAADPPPLPRVAATTPILADVAAFVAGPDAQVESLLPREADPHVFQPRPADLRRLRDADVLLVNGRGLEEPLRAWLASAGPARRFDLSEGLPKRRLSGEGHEEEHAHGDCDHKPGDLDPHVWLDPTLAARWADRIAGILAEQDPKHAEDYRARAKAFGQKTEELDRWIREQIARIPAGRRRLVTDHESFGYFCERYGLKQEASLFPGFSTLAQPSAREVARMEDTIRRHEVRALFTGAAAPPALAERVARDTGIRVVRLYTCTLSAPDGPAPDYFALMRFNVKTIVDHLP